MGETPLVRGRVHVVVGSIVRGEALRWFSRQTSGGCITRDYAGSNMEHGDHECRFINRFEY